MVRERSPTRRPSGTEYDWKDNSEFTTMVVVGMCVYVNSGHFHQIRHYTMRPCDCRDHGLAGKRHDDERSRLATSLSKLGRGARR